MTSDNSKQKNVFVDLSNIKLEELAAILKYDKIVRIPYDIFCYMAKINEDLTWLLDCAWADEFLEDDYGFSKNAFGCCDLGIDLEILFDELHRPVEVCIYYNIEHDDTEEGE